MIRYGFPPRFKLKKTDEFSSVFSFRRRIGGAFLAVHYMPGNLDFPRLGIVVGKKLVRRAHDRNYIKRVLREIFRLRSQNCPPVDMVIRVHKAFGPAEFAHVESEFAIAMDRILQNTRKTTYGVQ